MKQTKRSTPYEGDDIAEFINKNKTHTTPSYAFKDAKYSEWLEVDPEMSDMRLFITDLICFAVPLIITVCLVVFFVLKAVALS